MSGSRGFSADPSADARFRFLLGIMPAAAYTCDAQGLITYFNQRAVEVWGREPLLNDARDRWCGSFRLFTVQGVELKHSECWMARAMLERRAYNGEEIVVVRPDGERRVVLAHANPFFDEQGRLVGAVNMLVDISDRKEAELAMAAARVAAESASAAKSQFLAQMSHEIRTPLTAILGYTDLLADEPGGVSGRRGETIATIRRAGHHLMSVVNDVLDLSKIEAGMMSVEQVETEIPALLHTVASLVSPRAGAKGVSIVLRAETAVPEFAGTDPTRLRQILTNLLSNAVKFTEFGKVTVRVSAEEQADGSSMLRFDVEDTGRGMTPEQAERLFRPFAQGDESMTREHGGTGLGLVISQRLARMMGGDLRLVWSERGKGSRFAATVKVSPVAGTAMVRDLGVVSGEVSFERDDLMGSRSAATISLRGRILLAEDGVDNQRLIALHLRKAGAEVEVAANGAVALEMIEKAADGGKSYDLLLTDIQMPEMDGYALVRAVRERGIGLAVVALTAYAMSEDRERCLAAGCDDYVSKPVEKRDLLAVCARWMGRAVRKCDRA